MYTNDKSSPFRIFLPNKTEKYCSFLTVMRYTIANNCERFHEQTLKIRPKNDQQQRQQK